MFMEKLNKVSFTKVANIQIGMIWCGCVGILVDMRIYNDY